MTPENVDTVVIGAGQAGLAASRCLVDRGVDHVVLDRGRVGERWRSERWDSLRLLTPNWMSRLPGWRYAGADPHGFMTAAEFTASLESYAAASEAPIVEDSAVVGVKRTGRRLTVRTASSHWSATTHWSAANVVIATGWCDRPAVPAVAAGLDPGVTQVNPSTYRNPDTLPAGGVLVVGASATGVQLADELARSGRRVVLAVGGHSRLPRRYRGMDIWWWLEQTGSLDRTVDEVADVAAARNEPSLQLVGRPDHADVDLPALAANGVELTGRMVGIDGHRVRFAADLAATVATADDRMRRLLAEIDAHVTATGLGAEVLEPHVPATLAATDAPEAMDLRARGIGSVVWATGYRRAYPWLHLPVFDGRGEIRQYRGVTPVRGMYVLGQRFQHRRRSNFIDGVGFDAEHVADHLIGRTTPVSRA